MSKHKHYSMHVTTFDRLPDGKVIAKRVTRWHRNAIPVMPKPISKRDAILAALAEC